MTLPQFSTLVLAILIAAVPVAGQQAQLTGTVQTSAGMPVAAATLVLTGGPQAADRITASDDQGNFRFIGIVAGDYRLVVTHIGYTEIERSVTVAATGITRVDVVLAERAIAVEGVRVEADRARVAFEEEAGTTVRELTRAQVKAIPGVGEADVLRAVEVLPGVVSTSDFSSAFNVRGGSADQNLILLDGLPLYNPFHLGGVFSVFNADMVGRAELMAGGFPARYGGRVSSVLNVESDAGGGGVEGTGGVSLLATRVALASDVPAQAAGFEAARIRASLRRSYFDVLFRPFFDFPYHLTDAQLFVDAVRPSGARLTVTGYTGRDVLDLRATDDFPLAVDWTWGNDMIGASYVVPLHNERVLDVRAGFTRFDTQTGFPDFEDTDFSSGIDHLLGRVELELPVAPGTRARVGVALDHIGYANRASSGGTDFRASSDEGWLVGTFAQATWRRGDWIAEAGARLDAWQPRRGEPVVVAAPRVAVKRFLGDDVAIKFAAGRYAQFVHSLRDEELPLGIDVWIAAGQQAPHTVSDQVQLGVESFFGARWFASLEGYARMFDGVVANNFVDDPNTPLDDVLAGTGESWGADLLVRYDDERLRSTLALSFLKAWRRFPDTRAAADPPPQVRYAPVFDRRVDLDLVVQARLPWRLEGGLRLNFGSGLPFTEPLSGYRLFGYSLQDGDHTFDSDSTAATAVVLGPRNGARYPHYLRLDAGVRRTMRTGWGVVTPYLDVLNLTNRRNPLFYFYEFDRDPPQRSGISMFPLLPTVGVEFTF